jgi:hypothetical protein
MRLMIGRRRSRSRILNAMTLRARFAAAATAVACASSLALAADAPAATQVGETLAPSASFTGYTILQSSSPADRYTVPTAGVITSWSFFGGASPSQIKLKVARPAGGTSFTIVGDSPLKLADVGVLNTYTDVRIPVQQGDVLGLYDMSGAMMQSDAGVAYGYRTFSGDPSPGTTMASGGGASFHLDVSAILESDADNDGFGDETQDCAPADASKNTDCAPPETTITAGPKDKTKKKTATFEFSANEPGATFECSLDGGPFTACTSPDTLKVKKGKHHFEVRATDVGGNVGSPASDDWKVKKKKRK